MKTLFWVLPECLSALLGFDKPVFLLAHRLYLCVGRVSRAAAELHGGPLAGTSLDEEEAGCGRGVMVDVHSD